MRTVPKIQSAGCKPYLEVVSGTDHSLMYSNKTSPHLVKFKTPREEEDMVTVIRLQPHRPVQLQGDMIIRIKNKNALKNSLICRFAINTSFIKENSALFLKSNVDPDTVQKDPR